MTKKTTIAAAMGREDGDHLILENQWARVVITREKRYDITAKKERWVYAVAGDTWDGPPEADHQLRPTQREYVFNTAPAAMRFAMQSLAAYEHGAPRG